MGDPTPPLALVFLLPSFPPSLWHDSWSHHNLPETVLSLKHKHAGRPAAPTLGAHNSLRSSREETPLFTFLPLHAVFPSWLYLCTPRSVRLVILPHHPEAPASLTWKEKVKILPGSSLPRATLGTVPERAVSLEQTGLDMSEPVGSTSGHSWAWGSPDSPGHD